MPTPGCSTAGQNLHQYPDTHMLSARLVSLSRQRSSRQPRRSDGGARLRRSQASLARDLGRGAAPRVGRNAKRAGQIGPRFGSAVSGGTSRGVAQMPRRVSACCMACRRLC
eukprot:3615798-Pleurochrysis_carterae.AAC.1